MKMKWENKHKILRTFPDMRDYSLAHIRKTPNYDIHMYINYPCIYVYAHITFVMHAHILTSLVMNIECIFLYFSLFPACNSKKSENFRSHLFYTDSPQFTIVELQNSQLYDGTKAIRVQEKLCCKLWILIFSVVVICSGVLSCDAGAGAASSSSQAALRFLRPNNRHSYNPSEPRQLFCFVLSVQFSINYMRYSILYYKGDFMLGNFAQLTFMLGKCSEHI